MLAVIKTGGKQYLVFPGDKIKIEKVEGKEGEEVVFDKVLLVEDKGKVEIGTPFIEEKKVVGKILEQGVSDKVIVFRYKSKTRRKKKKGHRQKFTSVEIVKLA